MSKTSWLWTCGSSFFLLFSVACSSVDTVEINDRQLARVQNKFLMESELAGLTTAGISAADSTLVANAYVERWVRDQALMLQAEKNIPKDLNIDELVRDYRASLVRYHYEKLIVEVELDSVVTNAELMAQFNKRQEEFMLSDQIYQYQMIAISEEDPNLLKVEEWWENPEDAAQWQLLTSYCNEAAIYFALGDEEWIKEPALAALLPKSIKMSNLTSGKRTTSTEDGVSYFLSIREKKKKGELSPLLVVEDQLKKVILHRRKIDLLESKIKETYERESELNNIEIFK